MDMVIVIVKETANVLQEIRLRYFKQKHGKAERKMPSNFTV